MDNICIVLVEPQDCLNIGSVARAMSNLGFVDLRLVNPRAYNADRAAVTACGGKALLKGIKIFPSLEAALNDCRDVIGFSCRSGRNRAVHRLLSEWLTEFAADQRRTALMFGSEDSGLTQEQVEHCRLLVRIPAIAESSSFNLAQAVLIVLYEISKVESIEVPEQQELPTWNDYYQLDRIIDEIGKGSGFFRQGTPKPIPGLIKGLFRRMRPSRREIGLVLGYLSRVNRCLAGEVPVVSNGENKSNEEC